MDMWKEEVRSEIIESVRNDTCGAHASEVSIRGVVTAIHKKRTFLGISEEKYRKFFRENIGKYRILMGENIGNIGWFDS